MTIHATSARVFLRGGMGNQFFEWLYALTLLESGINVALDASFLRKVRGNQAVGEVELFKAFSDLRMPLRSAPELWRVEPLFVRLVHLLGQLCTDSDASKNSKSGRYHYGYYQHPRYFSESALRHARQLLRPALRANPTNLHRYAALHIRRGDYASSKYNREQIGVVGYAYYHAVLQALAENWPELPVLIVSDDYAHARSLLEPVTLSTRHLFLDSHLEDQETPDQALQTMLNAEILACANSSFSAMAGYLGNALAVFAPTPWFRSSSLAPTDPSLPGWHRLNADFS